jgi:hypothetical protein
MRQLLTILLATLVIPAVPQSILPGYHAAITGEVLSYHAPQPDATVSLLVRSEDENRYIEWQTCQVPGNLTGPDASPSPFLLLAGIDVNPEDPHSWKVFVNDRHFFTLSSPVDTISKTLTWSGPEGSSLVFKTKEVDKYGDFMGYLYCNLPTSMLKPGEPVRFRVVGESAGSRTWFMVFQYETVDKVSLTAEQAVMRGKKKNSQVLRAEIVRYADPVGAEITIAGKKMTRTLGFGHTMLYLPVPQIMEETTMNMTVRAGKEVLANASFPVKPVEPRTIYLLHHSHNDIGYTHVQPEVEKMQWNNLEKAIEMTASTEGFPAGSQLKYCTEVMWAVESWYDSASPEKKESFRQAVKAGSIELNGLFANELVSLCGPEELDRLLEAGRRISRECGVDLTSAMITDIPGWSWALVPALANSGVKYLSLGTNRGHRIGNIIDVWGDKPFYWVSPSGEEEALSWIHGEGYSLFHTGLAYNTIRKRLQEDLVFKYLNTLAENHYPYHEVMLRYNIGSDNGPVDETLPHAVKEWNEKYVTPQIVISTVEEAFSLFEQNHGRELPRVSGDITCYWEDGAYSTARETILNRNNASRMIQAQALWAMYNPSGYPEKDVRDAWRNILLYDEHTWGSWNSVSEPESPFTLQQWEIKKSFALDAAKQGKKLFIDAMTSRILGGPAADAVEVINTCGWKRSGLITLSTGAHGMQLSLTDNSGREIPTQALSDGNITFIATDIPAFGSKIFKITNQTSNPPISQSPNPPISQSPNPPTSQYSNYQIESSRFILALDPLTGAISSLTWKKNGMELVDTTQHSGLNEYLYVEGRMPENPLQARLKEVNIVENGPIVSIIKVEIEAPGCKSMNTTIRIIDDLDMVEITNALDKEKVLSSEAVHLAFPFAIADGIMRYDLANGYCRPEHDQIPGSNKNYLAMEHWLDISGEKNGVTVMSPDVPLFEAGSLTMDEIVYGWVDSIPPSQTFFSYLMNNYWETNYAAAQEGLTIARYIIRPHEGFDPAAAEKDAIGQRQPLVTRKGGGWMKELPSLLDPEPDDLVITSLKPAGNGNEFTVTIYNAGIIPIAPAFKTRLSSAYITDPDGIKDLQLSPGATIPPGGIRHMKVKL